MTPMPTGTGSDGTPDRALPWPLHSHVPLGRPPATRDWYGRNSGVFIVEKVDHGGLWPADSFPAIRSSSGIDRRPPSRSTTARRIATLPVARQVRELQAGLSVNKSELARILGVSRPTVYDWLDGGEPNAANIERIRRILGILSNARVSPSNPLFPRFVRVPNVVGDRALVDLLREPDFDEDAVEAAVREAKAMGDALDRQRREREARLRAAGFEEPDEASRRSQLAANVALLDWPRD